MPGGASARLDRIRIALASLREEERRLLLLGLETPLERCREQRRYWEFLEGVIALSRPDDRFSLGSEEFSWRTVPSR
jgi:hypothetical protein